MNQPNCSTAATAQGDGDPRAFDVNSEADETPTWNLGTMGQPAQDDRKAARRLLHLAKPRRPEFVPMSVADMLGASLVAQTSTTTGEVLSAIQRKCFLDLMAAWTRLIKIHGVTVNGQSRTAMRRDWFWGEAFDAIVAALSYCETEQGPAKWIVADMVLRGEAAEQARLTSLALAPYGDAYAPELEQARENLAAYRRFAEGQ